MSMPSTNVLPAGEPTLVFEIADRYYAIPVTYVREVLPLAALIAVPEAPEAFVGILRLRGSLLPVIDLRSRLGLPRRLLDPDQRIIVVLIDAIAVGLLVDAIHELVSLPESRVPADTSPQRVLIRRAFEIDAGMVLLIDVDTLLEANVHRFITHVIIGLDDQVQVAVQPEDLDTVNITGLLH